MSDLLPGFWETWTDPRQHAGQINDNIPVALFPLRLETRFKTVTGRAEQQQQQLWVRIYPDECLVDTYEELLSETELYSAAIFWREYFHAAGARGRRTRSVARVGSQSRLGPRDLDRKKIPAIESARCRMIRTAIPRSS